MKVGWISIPCRNYQGHNCSVRSCKAVCAKEAKQWNMHMVADHERADCKHVKGCWCSKSAQKTIRILSACYMLNGHTFRPACCQFLADGNSKSAGSSETQTLQENVQQVHMHHYRLACRFQLLLPKGSSASAEQKAVPSTSLPYSTTGLSLPNICRQ